VRHEPERLAARFLDGQMRRPERWRFERHLVECAVCWNHVQQARAGRSAAESLRVVAPSRTRERVRAVPEIDAGAEGSASRRHPAPFVLSAVAVLVALVLSVLVTQDDGDRAEDTVAEVVAAYRDTTAWATSTAAPPVRALAGLRWVESRVTAIDDDRVLGFRYAAGSGASVLVVEHGGSFATPPTARPVRGGEWVTEVGGVTVFCTHLPGAVLVVGSEPGLVAKAARSLTERES
jgi:hypothetical protein